MPTVLALDNFESFCFFNKSIWNSSLNAKKFHLNIPDTILFKNGVPIRWLFTSEQTGVSSF